MARKALPKAVATGEWTARAAGRELVAPYTPPKRAKPKPATRKRAPMRERQSPPMPPLLVTVEDAAALLNVSRNQVYRLLNTGMLPSLKIGRWRRISLRALDLYVNGPTVA